MACHAGVSPPARSSIRTFPVDLADHLYHPRREGAGTVLGVPVLFCSRSGLLDHVLLLLGREVFEPRLVFAFLPERGCVSGGRAAFIFILARIRRLNGPLEGNGRLPVADVRAPDVDVGLLVDLLDGGIDDAPPHVPMAVVLVL